MQEFKEYIKMKKLTEITKEELIQLQEFCDSCSLCVEVCLGEAIFKKPIEKEGGILTHIDREACLEMLRTQRYCSLCLKVCPPAVEPKAKKFKTLLKNVEYSLL